MSKFVWYELKSILSIVNCLIHDWAERGKSSLNSFHSAIQRIRSGSVEKSFDKRERIEKDWALKVNWYLRLVLLIWHRTFW